MSTVKTQQNPETATQSLWRIAQTNDTRQLAAILAAGADINASTEHGMTALMRAASLGRTRMVSELLRHGADPNLSRNDKFTALMLGAFFGHEEVVRVLVEHGADSNAATRFGTSAQMWASARTNQDVAHYLKKPPSAPSKEAALDEKKSHTPPPKRIPAASIDPAVNVAMPAVAQESSAMKVEPMLQSMSPVVDGPADTPRDVSQNKAVPLRVYESSVLSSSPWSFSKRASIYAFASFLVIGLITGLLLRYEQWNGAIGSKTQPTTPAPITTSRSTLGTLVDVNNAATIYKPIATVVENKPPESFVTRSEEQTQDSTKDRLSVLKNRVASTEKTEVPTIPLREIRLDSVPIPELPAVSRATNELSLSSTASITKTEQNKSRITSLGGLPPSLAPQLISPSKSSPPKGRAIQWP